MLWYNKKFVQYFEEGVPFELNGISYPSNWLTAATEPELSELGFEKVVYSNIPEDNYFYVVTVSLTGALLTYVNTPKDIQQLKKDCAVRVKMDAYAILQTTDYMDSRKVNDPAYVPPAAWITWRASVRNAAANALTAVNAATDINGLKAAIAVDWPKNPDAKDV